MSKLRMRLLSALVVMVFGGSAHESDAQPGAGGKGCMHGGSGAESCGYTFVGGQGYGCSVTCYEGYSACCTLTGCNCVRDPKTKK